MIAAIRLACLAAAMLRPGSAHGAAAVMEGINTTNATLHVSTAARGINVGANGRPDAVLHVTSTHTTNSEEVFLVDNDSGSELFRVQRDGKVGISSATPTDEMSVSGSVNISGSYKRGTRSGSSPTACTSSQVLQGLDIVGGIVVGAGSCAAAGSGDAVLAGTQTFSGTNTFSVGPPDSAPTANALYNVSFLKAWAKWSVAGGVPSYEANLNFSGSITDNGAGDFTFTIDTDCATTASMVFSGFSEDAFVAVRGAGYFATTSVRVVTQTSSGTNADKGINGIMLVCKQ